MLKMLSYLLTLPSVLENQIYIPDPVINQGEISLKEKEGIGSSYFSGFKQNTNTLEKCED